MESIQGDNIESPSLAEQKQSLRKTIKGRLKTVSPDELRQAGLAAAERLKTHPRWKRAPLVLLYASMAGEIDTAPLFRLAKTGGKTLFYPRIEGEEIQFYQVDEVLDLQPQGPWHILEPRQGLVSLLERLNAISSSGNETREPIPILGIIPGLAFDRQGGRLGKGKGYYDRFLSSIEKKDFPYSVDLYTIGLCIPEQVLERVPRSPLDRVLNEIIILDKGLAPEVKIF